MLFFRYILTTTFQNGREVKNDAGFMHDGRVYCSSYFVVQRQELVERHPSAKILIRHYNKIQFYVNKSRNNWYQKMNTSSQQDTPLELCIDVYIVSRRCNPIFNIERVCQVLSKSVQQLIRYPDNEIRLNRFELNTRFNVERQPFGIMQIGFFPVCTFCPISYMVRRRTPEENKTKNFLLAFV